MDDNSIIHFGIHKGKKLANVPAGYLVWLCDSKNVRYNGPLKVYIDSQIEDLRREARKTS